jgi:hypothetical protein
MSARHSARRHHAGGVDGLRPPPRRCPISRESPNTALRGRAVGTLPGLPPSQGGMSPEALIAAGWEAGAPSGSGLPSERRHHAGGLILSWTMWTTEWTKWTEWTIVMNP